MVLSFSLIIISYKHYLEHKHPCLLVPDLSSSMFTLYYHHHHHDLSARLSTSNPGKTSLLFVCSFVLICSCFRLKPTLRSSICQIPQASLDLALLKSVSQDTEQVKRFKFTSQNSKASFVIAVYCPTSGSLLPLQSAVPSSTSLTPP